MTAATIRKFTYDTIFTPDGGETRAEPAQRFSYRPEEVEAAKAEAYAEGERSAVARAERDAAQALDAIAASLKAVTGRLGAESAQLRRNGVELSLAAARAAAETALANYPVDVVEGLFQECLESLRGAPHVRAFAPEAVREEVERRLKERAQAAGLEGLLAVDAGSGPARLEWGSGAVDLDPDAALDAARRAAERWLAAQDAEDGQMSLFEGSSEQGVSDDV